MCLGVRLVGRVWWNRVKGGCGGRLGWRLVKWVGRLVMCMWWIGVGIGWCGMGLAGKFEGEFNGSGLLVGEGMAAGSGGSVDEESTGRFSEPEGIAVDNDPSSPSAGDVYVVDTGHTGLNEHGELVPFRVVDKFSGTGKYLGQITAYTAGYEYFLGLTGVAVDAHGMVWVADEHRNEKGERVEGVDTFAGAASECAWRFCQVGRRG